MNSCVLVLLLITAVCGDVIERNSSSSDVCPNVKRPLSLLRKRRHLAFGDGSFLILTNQLVKTFVFRVPSGWNLALEMDIMYPLPDAKFVGKSYRKKLHHRQKREFWQRLRDAMEFHNLSGRTCILRSVCEARLHLAPPGRSLVHDILRTIFTVSLDDEEFAEEMKDSYQEMFEPEFCDKQNDCPISILSLILALNKQKYYFYLFYLKDDNINIVST